MLKTGKLKKLFKTTHITWVWYKFDKQFYKTWFHITLKSLNKRNLYIPTKIYPYITLYWILVLLQLPMEKSYLSDGNHKELNKTPRTFEAVDKN